MTSLTVVLLLVIGVASIRGWDTSTMMDTSVNPCDDFYQYACGKFIKEANVTDADLVKSYETTITGKVKAEIKKLLSDPVSPDDTQATAMLKKYYQGCMNVDLTEKLGVQPLKDLVHTYWPFDKFDEKTYSWMDMTARLFREQGISTFFAVSSILYENGKDTLTIDTPNLLPGGYEYYLDDSYSYKIDAVKAFLDDIYEMLGGGGSSDAEEIIDLDRKLAHLINESVALIGDRSEDTLLTTVADLKTRYNLPFTSWLSSMAENGLAFDDQDPVRITFRADNYLTKLSGIMSGSTPYILANYQLNFLAKDLVALLSPTQRQPWVKYSVAFYNDPGMVPDPRDQECTSKIIYGDLSWPVSSVYVRYVFNTSTVDKVNDIYYRLKKLMGQLINDVDWMDLKTATMARKKLNSIVPQLIYPDYTLDESIILRDFGGVEMDETRFFDSAISLGKITFNRVRRELKGKPQARYGWLRAPLDWYGSNIVELESAAIVQSAIRALPPLLMLEEEDLVNVGRIGMELARLFVRHFNSRGCGWDGKGTPTPWCSDAALSHLQNADACFDKQYSQIVDPVLGYPLKGKIYQGTSVAYIGAIKIIFKAFREWEALNKLTSNNARDRYFFIAHAQGFCAAPTPAFRKRVLDSEGYAPAGLSFDYAVNIPLQHFKTFSEIFNCPSGSKMNPVEKCDPWITTNKDPYGDKVIHI